MDATEAGIFGGSGRAAGDGKPRGEVARIPGAEGRPPLLAVEGVRKSYAAGSTAVRVLDGVSFRLEAGEAAVVLGPSGSGKSTLLNIIGTLDSPDAGSVAVDGLEVTRLDPDGAAEYRRRNVGFVFQDHHLLPQCTAMENVLLPALAAEGTAGAEAKRERAMELLDRLGIAGLADRFPHQLSGGERQRAAIARALINRPRLVLADEPTGNLDRTSAETAAELLIESCRSDGAALIFVTHNLGLAGRFDRIFELRDGRLMETRCADAGGLR